MIRLLSESHPDVVGAIQVSGEELNQEKVQRSPSDWLQGQGGLGQLRPSSSPFMFLQAGRKVEKRQNDYTCKELIFLIHKQTPMGREEKKGAKTIHSLKERW